MLSVIWDREKKPLVHNITNYVTANDVANAELAVGGAPIMADSPEEAAEITAVADALNINIGTLSPERLRAMLISGGVAKEKGIPVLLDLVGAGASQFRKNAAKKLAAELSPQIIKGNASELCAVIRGGSTRGVDAANEAADIAELAGFAKKTGAVVVATGRADIVTDGSKTYIVKNGGEMLGRITGTGCMLSGILAVLSAMNKGNILDAALVGVMLSGVSGEKAEARMSQDDGSGSFKVYLMDAFSNITLKEIEEHGRYEII